MTDELAKMLLSVSDWRKTYTIIITDGRSKLTTTKKATDKNSARRWAEKQYPNCKIEVKKAEQTDESVQQHCGR